MKRPVLVIVILFIFLGNIKAQSQKIKIDVVGISLNEVFIELRDKYGVQFSFDDQLLSEYIITTNMEFDSKQAAVSYLVSGLPLSYEKSGDIFIVFPLKQKKPAVKKTTRTTRVSGQVVEAKTYEPLPFSYIVINNKQVQSDQNGNFSFIASADTSFNMHISHLGYYVYDTLFNHGFNRKFFLLPSVKELEEVKVEGFDVEHSTLIGDAAGEMKVNHTIAPYLPGYGDNSIYNVLRLMPGVLASGEQSSDLLVWGSYESHSKLKFDGFTIFGLKNFNDNIGVVNPLLIKDIRVLKGGYEANYGDRVGGIIEITGKNGNRMKPAFTMNISNSTINALVEMPIGEKSTLLGAYRQTYYELYNPYDLNIFSNVEMNMNSSWEWQNDSHHGYDNVVDVLVVPEYKFRDGNFKYTFRGDNGNVLSASLYGGGDRYSYNVEGENGSQQFASTLNEKNRQIGVSVNYTKIWDVRHRSQIIFSYSGLLNKTNETNYTSTTTSMGNNNGDGMWHGMENDTQNEIVQADEKILEVDNSIDEFSAELSHNYSFVNGVEADFGLGYQMNNIWLEKRATGENQINLSNQLNNVFMFAQGSLPLFENLLIKPGVRVIHSGLTGEFYVEPKLSVSYSISRPLKINASFGQYHQFISKTSFVDSNLNTTLYWTASDGAVIPVLGATHFVSGVSYNENNFLLSVEGYFKQTSGITRYYSGASQVNNGFYSGESRSFGIDFYIKKEYKKNVAWIAYTISKTEENLSVDNTNQYRLAPQHQKHELKLAGIYNLKAFYFSANYVYGSGFEIMRNFTGEDKNLPIYSRLDIAAIYKFSKRRLFGKLGISVLNVLNQQNIKYTNLRRVENGDTELINIHSEAVPFTPTLFLTFSF